MVPTWQAATALAPTHGQTPAQPPYPADMPTFTHNPADVPLDDLWRLLRQTYWSSNIRREVVACAMANSIIVAALDDEPGTTQSPLVGFARLVTDRATFGWLCDVIVIPSHQRRGIAREMVTRLITHPETSTIRRFALATRDAAGVYAPLGFEIVPPNRWMEKRMDPARWQASTHSSVTQ
jgi:N-acetylglutamate synthase-like GNAT family acetyltransferase